MGLFAKTEYLFNQYFGIWVSIDINSHTIHQLFPLLRSGVNAVAKNSRAIDKDTHWETWLACFSGFGELTVRAKRQEKDKLSVRTNCISIP